MSWMIVVGEVKEDSSSTPARGNNDPYDIGAHLAFDGSTSWCLGAYIFIHCHYHCYNKMRIHCLATMSTE
jgi:hypothetical protein